MAQKSNEDVNLFVDAISRYFPDNAFELLIVLAACCNLLIRGLSQPICILLLGRAGSGKTSLLELIKDIQIHDDKLIIWEDDLTPARFVSGHPNVDPDNMLVNKLDRHVLAVAELAPISQNQQSKRLWGYIVRLLDGHSLVRGVSGGDVGNTNSMRWIMLAAIVKISQKMNEDMQNMGPRTVCLRLKRRRNGSFRSIVNKLSKQMTSRSYTEKLVIGRRLVNDFVSSIVKANPNGIRWNPDHDNKVAIDYISSISVLITTLSGNIIKESKNDSGTPDEDEPDAQRMYAIIYGICAGFEFLYGNSSITLNSLKVALRLVDTIPEERLDVLHALLKNNGTLTTVEYIKYTTTPRKKGISRGTAYSRFAELVTLGICEYTTSPKKITKPAEAITLASDYRWLLDQAMVTARQ